MMINHCKHIERINEVLKKTLEFYADHENYLNGKIKLDGGVQANYALNLAGQVEEEYLGAEEKYLEQLKEMKDVDLEELINYFESKNKNT